MRKMLITAALIVTTLSCSSDRHPASSGDVLERGMLEHDGLQRTY